MRRNVNGRSTMTKNYSASATFVPATTSDTYLYSGINLVPQGGNAVDNDYMIGTTQCEGWDHNVSTLCRLFFILLHPTDYRNYVTEIPWRFYSSSDREVFKLYPWFAMMTTHGKLHNVGKTHQPPKKGLDYARIRETVPNVRANLK